GAYAITLFLPVRSSLYAVFPSVGAAIAAGALVESMQMADGSGRPRAMAFEAVLAGALLLLIPIYSARNDRFVEPARLSERALRIMAKSVQRGGTIVLLDVDDPTSSFAAAFGTLATEAVRLRVRPDLTIWIDQRPPEW